MTTIMTTLFTDFKEAHQTGDGRLLADTISPFGTLESTQWLVPFAQSSNFQTVSADMRYHLLQDRSTKVILPKSEGNAWVEIFVALWNTVKAILSAQTAGQQTKWLPVFRAYKELANLLIKGYSNHGFQAWTVPCLSAAGKYLRAFAAKADQEAKSQDSMTFGDGLQDDVVGNFGKNEKLEEAAWVINRMFTICLSDRLELSWHRCRSYFLGHQAYRDIGHQSKNPENGAYTLQPVCSSKRTLKSVS